MNKNIRNIKNILKFKILKKLLNNTLILNTTLITHYYSIAQKHIRTLANNTIAYFLYNMMYMYFAYFVFFIYLYFLLYKWHVDCYRLLIYIKEIQHENLETIEYLQSF